MKAAKNNEPKYSLLEVSARCSLEVSLLVLRSYLKNLLSKGVGKAKYLISQNVTFAKFML